MIKARRSTEISDTPGPRGVTMPFATLARPVQKASGMARKQRKAESAMPQGAELGDPFTVEPGERAWGRAARTDCKTPESMREHAAALAKAARRWPDPETEQKARWLAREAVRWSAELEIDST